MSMTPPHFTVDRPEHAPLFKGNLSHVGATLYETIAKGLTGTYETTYFIERAVPHFAHRVRAQQDHAFHREYLNREFHYQRSEGLPLYSGFECPDLRSNQDIMWVVAFALNISLQVVFESPVHGQAPGTIVGTGPTTGRIVTVAQRAGSKIMRCTYVALLTLDTRANATCCVTPSIGFKLLPLLVSIGRQSQFLSCSKLG